MASKIEELKGKITKAEKEELKLKQQIDLVKEDIVKEEVSFGNLILPKYSQRI